MFMCDLKNSNWYNENPLIDQAEISHTVCGKK